MAMTWTPLNFGKHRELTLPQVIFNDPDWFYWAYNEGVFRGKQVEQEANDIYRKSISIKIPQTGATRMVVEYTLHPKKYNFANMKIVPESREQHFGGSQTFRSNVINMEFPRNQANYDKTGYKIFLKNLKTILFGNPSSKFTKRLCHEFFSNDSNFDL